MLRSVNEQYVSDLSGQPVGPETSVTSYQLALYNIAKSEDVYCTAAKA
jgi:hypothetical protein